MKSPKMPNFFIVGAMKAGTTTLHSWLGLHPEVFLPTEKEPDYFTRDRSEMELRRYQQMFADAGDRLTGEASTSYTLGGESDRVAERISTAAPAAKAVYLLRDPSDRMRSHYRHEVRRSREARPFATAVALDPRYQDASCYYARILPFVERLGKNVALVAADQLFSDSHESWSALLDFLGVAPFGRPSGALNVGDAAPPFTRLGGLLWRTGVMSRASRLPAPIRGLVRPLAIGASDRQTELQETAAERLPAEVAQTLSRDADRLRSLWCDYACGASLPAWCQ